MGCWASEDGVVCEFARDAHLCNLNWPVPIVVFQVLDPVIEDLEVSWVYLQAGDVILTGIVFILVYICL